MVHLVLQHGLAVGNAIQTCENKQQAIARLDPEQKDKGGAAAKATIRMLEIKKDLVG